LFSQRADLTAAVTDLTGVVVPESDYPSVDTMDPLEHYLAARRDARRS
jgi:hypothetical protein